MFNSTSLRQYFSLTICLLLLTIPAISQSVHSLQTVQTDAGKISGVRAATSGVIAYAFSNLHLLNRPWEMMDRQLSERMSEYWVNFATSGDPNSKGLPRWRPFNASANETMEPGEKTGMRPIADSAKVRFFTDHFALPASRRSLF